MLGAKILFIFKVIIQLQKSFQNEKHKVTLKFTYLYISNCFHYIPVYFLCANLVNYTIYDVTEGRRPPFNQSNERTNNNKTRYFAYISPFDALQYFNNNWSGKYIVSECI